MPVALKKKTGWLFTFCLVVCLSVSKPVFEEWLIVKSKELALSCFE
jgi:hypothetical protein